MGAISLPYAQSLTIRGNSQQNIVDNHVDLSQMKVKRQHVSQDMNGRYAMANEIFRSFSGLRRLI